MRVRKYYHDLVFREVTLDNLNEIEELRVRTDQTELVAENIYSIAQAGLDPSGWCKAVYMNETPVGFFYVRDLDHGKKAYLCRFTRWLADGDRAIRVRETLCHVTSRSIKQPRAVLNRDSCRR